MKILKVEKDKVQVGLATRDVIKAMRYLANTGYSISKGGFVINGKLVKS